MTVDTSSLERTCVIYGCNNRAVEPDRGLVHCSRHQPDNTPAPPPPVELEAALLPPTPDMATLEPHWDGTQWVLRPKQDVATLACPHCGGSLEVHLK